MSDWVRGRAPDSHARGREFESLRWLHPFSGACELCLLQYLETNGETGGVASYCKPRHKGSLILSQDSVGGILEDGSPREVAGQYRCLPNQERVTE